MDIRIARGEILKGLGLIQGIVERKTTMPVLANVLLEANGKSLSLTATDLEVGMHCLLQGEVLTTGKVTVHARSVYDIVRELPEETIHLTVREGHWIDITCGKSRYKIVGLSPEEFPALPVRGQGESWGIDAVLLKGMIDRTSFAMSSDETRFNLNGVYLDPRKVKEGASLRMVATDGHRLSIVEREMGAVCAMSKGAIIPRKGVGELRKLAETDGPPMDLWTDGKHLVVDRDRVTLVIRLIDGQFPPYEQVLPKQSKHVISLKRETLMRALKRVSVLSNDRSRGVKFSLSPKNMEIFASNPDMGEAREELEIAYKGESFDVGFNAKYFLDALGAIDDEQAVLQMGDETSPCVLRSEMDRGFTHVIMPMRL